MNINSLISRIKDTFHKNQPTLSASPPTTRNDFDTLVEKAEVYVRSANMASSAYLQRKLQLDYNTVANLFDRLEELGVIRYVDDVPMRKIVGDLVNGGTSKMNEEKFVKILKACAKYQLGKEQAIILRDLIVLNEGRISPILMRSHMRAGYGTCVAICAKLDELGIAKQFDKIPNPTHLPLERRKYGWDSL